MRTRFCLVLLLSLVAASLFAQAAKPAAKSAPAAGAASAFLLPPRASGPPEAALVIEVFSDFECPTCRDLYELTLKRLIPEYCTTGKVYLIHHDFPLPQHRYSHLAALWADAAATVGKYEVVTDAIFSKQDTWAASGNVASVVAGVLSGGDFQKVKDVFQNHQADINAAIDIDLKAGKALDVKETPTMRVSNHGKVITEKQPGMVAYAILKKYIDQELQK
jgi:protein-disulfide isomerase